RVHRALAETAELLESLHDQTVALMNAGARLDDVVHTVRAPAHLLERPYLRPVYDEPEFIVRNVLRLYGGWWGGHPAPPEAAARPGRRGGAGAAGGRGRPPRRPGARRRGGWRSRPCLSPRRARRAGRAVGRRRSRGAPRRLHAAREGGAVHDGARDLSRS